MASLLLCGFAQAPAPAAPPVAPAQRAAEELGELLRPFRDAAGIEARLQLVATVEQEGAEPKLVAEAALSLRFARPVSGRLDVKGRQLAVEEGEADGASDGQPAEPRFVPMETSLIGDGESLYRVDHRARSFCRLGDSVASAGEDWPELLPLQVWAGTADVAIDSVESLADPPVEGWRGFAVEGDFTRTEYWFDDDGAFRRARVAPRPALRAFLRQRARPPVPEVRVEVEHLELHAEADPREFRAELPAHQEAN